MSGRNSQRLSPRPADNDTRLTATPDSSVFVNQSAAAPAADNDGKLDRWLSQIEGQQEVVEKDQILTVSPIKLPESGAGGHAAPNPVNHAQVLVPQDTPSETQALLQSLGVNLTLTPAVLGRKYVFDEFLRGRLVSLLAMGLSLRQAAAALGLSHTGVWKELKRNPELTEQVNAARFQAQIEPLLVILRESKRSWRAATWLMKYLRDSVSTREETPDEVDGRWEDKRRAVEEEFERKSQPPPKPVDPQIAIWAAEERARTEKRRQKRAAQKAAQKAAAHNGQEATGK